MEQEYKKKRVLADLKRRDSFKLKISHCPYRVRITESKQENRKSE